LATLVLPYAGFGPYHLARWRHLRAYAPEHGWEVVPIELLAEQDRYRWGTGASDADDGVLRFGFRSDGQDQVRWQDVADLLRRLAALAPDVVAVNGWALRDSMLMHAWCRLRGVPRLVVTDTTAADAPRKALREAAKRALLGGVGAAFAAGTASRAYVESLGVPRTRVTDGCDVVDNAHFARARGLKEPSSADRARFLTVARLVPEKNLVAAATAWLRFVGEHGLDWSWTIAGYGPQRATLDAIADRSGGHIRLLGAVDHEALPRVYADADVLWLPSLSEPWGLVINEAMAAGLPVAVSDRVGCHADLVTPATGWTFDPSTVEGLVAGLARVARDRPRWAVMGEAAAERIADWDLERFSRGLLAAGEIALSARGRRPSAPRASGGRSDPR
jgi:glycosyltransferase involved in cell wall biosynthesis